MVAKKLVKKAVKKKVEKKKVVKKHSKKSVGDGKPLLSMAHPKNPRKKVVKKSIKKSAKKAVKEEVEIVWNLPTDDSSDTKEKVYKWVNVVFHSESLDRNVKNAAELCGVPVSVKQYNENKGMFDKILFPGEYMSSHEGWGIELEKDDNVCKIRENEDGTTNKVVLFEFPKSVLDDRDKEYVDMLKGLEALELDKRMNSWNQWIKNDSKDEDDSDDYYKNGLINRYSDGSLVNPILKKDIEAFDKLIGSAEEPAELAALVRDKNHEEWEMRKEAYIASKIDNYEIDYLGEHTTFKAVANRYLDKEQKEIADSLGMSRFRYLLNWIEDILENVNEHGFFARGRVKVEGYNSFE